MIRFHHVTHTFESGHKGVKDVSLLIDKGEFVFLTGSSGAGKTTLLRHSYLEIRPDSSRGGQVSMTFPDGTVYDSTLTKDSKLPFFRRKIGVVFQDFRLMEDRDVFENVAFPLQLAGKFGKALKDRVFDVLTQCGIVHKAHSGVVGLSGGEKQRVAIARALVADPDLIVADEPTGNLDPENAKQVFKILQDASLRGTTVLMATHNPEFYSEYKIRRIKMIEGSTVNRDIF
ncbi:ATP-binding cassette domain-containing protein [bacterium]|nr:ATP-binding cassette domain-containing protein [bacterium]